MMTVAGWPKPENACSMGTTPGKHSREQGDESHDVIAPAAQTRPANTAISSVKEDDLIGRHAGIITRGFVMARNAGACRRTSG